MKKPTLLRLVQRKSRILYTLGGLIFAWTNFRDLREFDLFHENKTRKNMQSGRVRENKTREIEDFQNFQNMLDR